MPHIQIIEPEQAEGRLREIYDKLIESRGKLAEVHKIQSLNPETIVRHIDLYMSIMFGQSPLKRVQREMMAVVVSKANECVYCQVHHAEAVQHYWKDETRVQQLRQDYTRLELSPADRALCDYAWRLTREPGRANEEVLIQPLRAQGFSDRAILDATLVVSYFNFVNRIVLALGVPLEAAPGGYRYD
ncbi:MAG: peroxidase [Bacteroidetes bacterium]|nr:MAG: peroxidase [Bacteroidota bacterium]